MYLIVSHLRATLEISDRTNPCPTKELSVCAVIQTHTQLQLCNLHISMLNKQTTTSPSDGRDKGHQHLSMGLS